MCSFLAEYINEYLYLIIHIPRKELQIILLYDFFTFRRKLDNEIRFNQPSTTRIHSKVILEKNFHQYPLEITDSFLRSTLFSKIFHSLQATLSRTKLPCIFSPFLLDHEAMRMLEVVKIR